ncbi:MULTISPECIES: STM4012 family radical SAM protein [Streptomyces]|jgi:oxygen-independent coproporphyrinogen-3 oxidase|uniref:Heme chaperone HemW n=2 Tax=Streptomyces griseoaurantiacus TaxID=68213 RepID=A0ABZ1UVB2_9ACTN|nr:MULTISPECIES: STM4012 family radical SAM protein [Streptomyces]MBA5224003.1 STM4012 family radical SAM protein [Streptomyces griseoaurantiacus]MDX3089883.1 STM4012 family radical SAM protein [Streptomyces sp. ME12-02E]MDX3333465.1 STM4012 family radical SAM protein [Streptomyces sp. ME02-6978a]MDX3361877.1 STM4012 family radical SAM protein [Streptomyces sp. ME02-6978.2a]GHE62118.1 coproporphyrinogen III oxidase [Streptomyces griseoaurantiacus]
MTTAPATTATTPSAAEAAGPYQHYVYAYPHKSAYRRLPERPTLTSLWAAEDKSALSLYLHIPFCEVRCGFCNLFTRIGAPEGLTGAYLDALERQAGAVREALGEGEDIRFATAAFGGGTPTFLTAPELERLCDIAESRMGARLDAIPLSVEASPATATADRLAVLADRGATRLSLGVQSFVEAEARAAVRPQRRADVEAALARIREARIPVLNIDLIYGIDGQTEETWLHSLDAALAWAPEELYLYPLYVRPLTGLDRHRAASGPARDPAWDAQRLRLYRAGRDHLLARGYTQQSMRMFRRADAPPQGADDYACQTDGMIGLGCGARSYTSALHYSFDYAVGMHAIRGIIDDYVATEDFTRAEVGHRMDADEARRRHLLQSLLQAEGLVESDYQARFGQAPAEDFGSALDVLADRGWLAAADGRLRLTPEGLAHSDAVGPLLFSPAVRAAMAAYERK